MAERERENKKLDLITTIYSDELYPWLSGKAPWSREQGNFLAQQAVCHIFHFHPMTTFVLPLLLMND